jgi:hypothetical protein
MRATPGPFGWLQTLVGITLLIILFTYDTEDQRTAPQSFAFSAVCGFCLMLFSSGFLSHWAAQPGAVQVGVPGGWLSVIWVGSTIIFFFIDLMRMGSRGTVQGRAVVPANRTSATPAAAPILVTRPPAQEVATEPAAVAPKEEAPVEPPPQEMAVPNPPEAETLQPTPEPAKPAAAPASGPPPKAVGIYVNLLNEGLNMMRAVAAQDMGHGFYLIVEPMPEDETWEYQTGQVVRCQKKNLANGKHLVAIAEAPRA